MAIDTTIAKSGQSEPQSTTTGEDYESLVLYLIHDLEGPLAAMQTLLRLLGQRRFDLKRNLHAQLLQSTHTALNRVRLIVSDLLKVSRLEQGSQTVDWRDFPVSEVISECVDLVRIAAAEQEVTVAVNDYDHRLGVRADRGLLARVVDNLLFNAIRHNNSGGSVRLTVSDRRDMVVINVTNGGEGFGDINPSDLFEKFRQVHNPKNVEHRGAGLGLYFCKLAVTAMHGEIKAYQTEAGETCFSVSVGRGGKDT
jgi:two-component system phosphate regulon sensor histidine kinase PhoR